MPDFLSKNVALLAKVETTSGTDSSPTVGSNAVLVEQLQFSRNLETVSPDENRFSLDAGADIPAGGYATPNFRAKLRGAGTPGTAPDWGVLMQGCAFSETLVASDVTGTAQAGTASTLQLASSAISSDDDYIGAVIEITGGTGYNASTPKDMRRVITDSVASTDTVTVYPDWTTTPDATTTYEIHACAIYKPISTSIKTLSLYGLKRNKTAGDMVREIALGSAGTYSLSLRPRQPGEFNFQFRGSLQAATDESDPGNPTFTDANAPPYLNAVTYLGGSSVCLSDLQIDLNGNVQNADCPNEVYGYEGAELTERRIGGRITPPVANVAVRDTFASWSNQTEAAFWTAWGAVAGERMSVYVPALRYGAPQDQDINGFLYEGIPFTAVGNDTGVYITVW